MIFNNMKNYNMKKQILSAMLFLFVSLSLYSQNDKYTTALSNALQSLKTATQPADFVAASNTFSRIAAAEPKEWLPLYYAAYANLIAGFQISGKDMVNAQQYIDQAQTQLNGAAKLVSQPADLAEIGVLQAYIYIGKVTEDPMTKGAELSPQIFQELGKAAAMDPANPRVPFLQGMYTMNMPEFYGGGAKNALPLLEKAKTLFENAPADALRPSWGQRQNEELLKSVSK